MGWIKLGYRSGKGRSSFGGVEMPMMTDTRYLLYRPWLIPIFILQLWWKMIGEQLFGGLASRLLGTPA
jgi:hypothetical protein